MSGGISAEGQYAFDAKVGVWREWDPQGRAKPSKDYGNGDEVTGEIPPSVLRALDLTAQLYAGWTYGADPKVQQIDCTRWVFGVLDALHGTGLSKQQRDALYTRVLMSDLPRTASERDPLVAVGDVRTRGVVTALVDAGLGTAVAAEDATPGDFVQYWTGSNTWVGHAAQILSVRKTKAGLVARLLGSHRSCGGVGVVEKMIAPADPKNASRQQVWVVRPRQG